MSINISLVGVGKMGINHLRVLSEIKNINLLYIYDKNIKVGKLFSKKYNIKFTKDLNKIKKDSDAVIISTPTSTHLYYIKFFTDSVKKIFVEKPLVSNYDQALILKKTVDVSKIQCGFIERYNSAVTTLDSLINKKKIFSINFARTDKLSERIKDTDVIHDLMIHDIDLAILFNGKIKSLDAHGHKKGNKVIYACANLIHKNNAISRLEASIVTNEKKRFINVTAKDFYIDVNLLTQQIQISRQSKLDLKKYYTLNNKRNLSVTSKKENFYMIPRESLNIELKAFINFIQNKNLKVPNFLESLYNLKICKKINDEIFKKI